MRTACGTGLRQGRYPTFAGQQIWSSVPRRLLYLLTDATGTDALSITYHQRQTRGTGQKRSRAIWRATVTLISGLSTPGGLYCGSGSTHLPRNPLQELYRKSKNDGGRIQIKVSRSEAQTVPSSSRSPSGGSRTSPVRSNASLIARPTASATGGGKAFPT